MARKRKVYEDDDGRTIADMSGVSGPSLLRSERPTENRKESPPGPNQPDRPWEDSGMSRKERLMYVLGAMKATALIALAYIGGLGLVIFLLLKLWA